MPFDHRHIQNQSLHSSFDMNSIVFLIWFKFLTLLMSSSTITPFTCTYILKYFSHHQHLMLKMNWKFDPQLLASLFVGVYWISSLKLIFKLTYAKCVMGAQEFEPI